MYNGLKRAPQGFTLIELLVVVGIIALLAAILLPSLSRARESAKASTCGSYLRTFGSAFEMYAAQDTIHARSSGAFDHLRDGDVRYYGWVADVINLRVGSPGKMLCPSNQWRINEKVADYTGAASTGSPNPNRPHNVPVVSPNGPKSAEFWNQGYNTNYATTWQFSRGDPTAANGYGVNGDASDPSKCPRDGDGPLNGKHLDSGLTTPSTIALMGDSRAGDSGDSEVTSAYADTINQFADETVVRAGEFTVESFTDGMTVDYSSVTGDAGRMGHEFNDIEPLHNRRSSGTGGYANVLFADGHVLAVYDTGGQNDEPDNFLGPYKVGGSSFQINATGFKELRGRIWHGRVRGKPTAGGGSVE